MRPKLSTAIPAFLLGILTSILPNSAYSQNRLIQSEGMHAMAMVMEMPLTIGEAVPSTLPFKKILNYTLPETTLANFEGKLVILDFWASWCSNCTGAFSKLEALQREFPNQLQILLVNSATTQDTPDKIKAFISKWEKQHKQQLSLPIIYQDSVLDKVFPHKLLPHYVWIDGTGQLKAMTASAAVTTENIRAILEGKKVILPAKQDQLNVDLRNPLLLGHKRKNSADSLRSVITGNINGMGSWAGIHKDSTGKYINRVYATNLSILSLYELSYRDQLPFPFRNRVILAVKDSTRYDYPKGNRIPDWSMKNTYSYELTVPSTLSDHVFQIMRKNLNDYFRCEVRIEKRPMLCLILAKKKKRPSITTTGGKQEVSFLDSTVIKNRPLKILTDALAHNRQAPPVLDETGYTGNVDMVLNASITELPKLKKELHKYGLDLIKATREVDMIVISDVKTK